MNSRISRKVKLRCIELINNGNSVTDIAKLFDLSRKTIYKWLNRYQELGIEGLEDHSTRPQNSPGALSDHVIQQIISLRVKEKIGPARIALRLGLTHSSVYRTLCRQGLQYLQPKKPRKKPQRYEKTYPGELLHLDTKTLVPLRRGYPKEHQFAILDDYSREAFCRIYPAATTRAATDFLYLALEYYNYPVKAVLTDNAFCFSMRYAAHASRLTLFAQTCRDLGIRHYLLRPYHPETNGKVERFFRTIDDECYNRIRLRNSLHRSQVLDAFVQHYNFNRPHLSLKGLTPVQRRINYFKSVTDVLE